MINPVLPDSQITEMNHDTSSLFITWIVGNPVGTKFATKIEHDHYPPGTPANDQLQIYLYNWPGQFPYIILRIPLQDRWIADRVCEELGIRIEDGFPHVCCEASTPNISFVGNIRKPPPSYTVQARFPLCSRRTFGIGQRPKDMEAEPRPILSGIIFDSR